MVIKPPTQCFICIDDNCDDVSRIKIVLFSEYPIAVEPFTDSPDQIYRRWPQESVAEDEECLTNAAHTQYILFLPLHFLVLSSRMHSVIYRFCGKRPHSG